jgi:hypothetical protein
MPDRPFSAFPDAAGRSRQGAEKHEKVRAITALSEKNITGWNGGVYVVAGIRINQVCREEPLRRRVAHI